MDGGAGAHRYLAACLWSGSAFSPQRAWGTDTSLKVGARSPCLLPSQLPLLFPFPETHLLLFLEMHSLVTADTMASTGTSHPNRVTTKLEASGAWGREIGMWDRKGWQRHSLSVLGCHPGGTASPTTLVAGSPSRRLLLPGVSRLWRCPPASGHTTPMNLLRGCLSSWSPRVQGIMSVTASQRVAHASLPSVTWELVKNADLWGPLQTY